MKIIVPSYKRAGECPTVALLKELVTIAVHEFEVDEYRAAYPENDIMVLPDTLRKNMAKVRNFIRDNAGDKELIMIDDDVKCFRMVEGRSTLVMSLSEIMEMFTCGFVMSYDLGVPLWGINVQYDPQFYREYSPFSMLSPVLGTFCCHIISDDDLTDIRYDENLSLNEDFDFFLQTIRKHRKILRFNKYSYQGFHLEMKGGCGAHRILDEEKRQADEMIAKWGKHVVSYNFDRGLNPRIHTPLKGI